MDLNYILFLLNIHTPMQIPPKYPSHSGISREQSAPTPSETLDAQYPAILEYTQIPSSETQAEVLA